MRGRWAPSCRLQGPGSQAGEDTACNTLPRTLICLTGSLTSASSSTGGGRAPAPLARVSSLNGNIREAPGQVVVTQARSCCANLSTSHAGPSFLSKTTVFSLTKRQRRGARLSGLDDDENPADTWRQQLRNRYSEPCTRREKLRGTCGAHSVQASGLHR